MTNKILFPRQILRIGDSTGITLPQEVLQYLEAQIGDTFLIQPEKGKKGKYISIWKEEK